MVFIQLDTLADWPAALRSTGRLLASRRAAQRWSVSVEAPLAKVAQVTARIPAEQAHGCITPKARTVWPPIAISRFTPRPSSWLAVNVHRCQPKDHTRHGKSQPGAGAGLCPDIIIAQDAQFARVVAQTRAGEVKAVRAGWCIAVPRWLQQSDRPPAVADARAGRAVAAAGLFYPKQLPFDRLAHTERFISRCWGEPDGARH